MSKQALQTYKTDSLSKTPILLCQSTQLKEFIYLV